MWKCNGIENIAFESVKETTGFDLTEVMKANTYDAKTTKNVNFTGLPEDADPEIKVTVKNIPEKVSKTEKNK